MEKFTGKIVQESETLSIDLSFLFLRCYCHCLINPISISISIDISAHILLDCLFSCWVKRNETKWNDWNTIISLKRAENMHAAHPFDIKYHRKCFWFLIVGLPFVSNGHNAENCCLCSGKSWFFYFMGF